MKSLLRTFALVALAHVLAGCTDVPVQQESALQWLENEYWKDPGRR